MTTYTFITDFRGGTYVCQKEADDLRTACLLWKDEIISGGYVSFLDTHEFTQSFDYDIDELPPVPLDEVKNVWLFSLMFGDDMLNLHIIQTDTVSVDVLVAV
jgi:hypothetical protein